MNIARFRILGLGVLELSPNDFWKMSVGDFIAALEGQREKNHDPTSDPTFCKEAGVPFPIDDAEWAIEEAKIEETKRRVQERLNGRRIDDR